MADEGKSHLTILPVFFAEATTDGAGERISAPLTRSKGPLNMVSELVIPEVDIWAVLAVTASPAVISLDRFGKDEPTA